MRLGTTLAGPKSFWTKAEIIIMSSVLITLYNKQVADAVMMWWAMQEKTPEV